MNSINRIQKNIADMIKSGKIKQRPKWFYVLSTFAFVFGLISLSLMLLYLVSFVSLILRDHLFFDAFAFGPGEVFDILHAVPLLLIALVLTVLLTMQAMVRHFAFAYMRPVAVTLGIGLTLTLILFSSVLYFDRDSRIARLGEHRQGVAMLHAAFRGHPSSRMIRGVVTEKTDTSYTVQEETGKVITVIVDEFTRKDKEDYEIGDSVAALLMQAGDLFRAAAIRIDDGMAFPRHMMRP